MVKMSAVYLGEKHCQAKHEPSQSLIETDAPKDNQGRGASFSPTDLLATALGTCVLTTIAIFAEKEGLDIKGASMRTEKVMASQPRRVASLKTLICLPKTLTAEQRFRFEEIGLNCPVKLSLHSEIDAEIQYEYV
jgi:uncharacterized OsmC-like protein